MEIVEVWGPPTSLAGRVVQLVYLSTLLGAVPLAIAAHVLLKKCRGRRSSALVGISRTGALLQACGVVSSLLLAGLFVSEADVNNIPNELIGPLGTILGLAWVNLAVAALGLRAWLALAIANSRI